MSPKIDDIVATLREYAPDEDGTQRYILIPAAGRGAIAEYPVTVRSHRTDIMREAADLIEQLQQELIDERYRHDRLQDFCVAQGEELSACKSDMTAYVQRKIRDECDLCKRAAPREFCREVDYGCAICNHTAGCVCARCRAGDQFEWRGVPVPEPPMEENHDKDIEPELVERVTHKPDAQLRPLQDMDEIKYYMGEEPKEEK